MIVITNHPIGGPVFSGPQVTPYHCNPNASNPRARARDRRAVQRSDQGRLPLPQREQPVRRLRPGEPAGRVGDPETTTDAGKTVPFIVQRVTGTADRGIYQIAVLVDPTKPIEPWSTDQPWSHKLFYPSAAHAGTTTRSGALERAPGDAARPSASRSPTRASTSTPRTATTSSRPRRR